LVVPWRAWFAIAYVPLLLTVVLGVLMSGWGQRVMTAVGVVVAGSLGALWITLKLPPADVDRVVVVLRVGMIALSGVGAAAVCVAAWGWFRCFHGRPAAA